MDQTNSNVEQIEIFGFVLDIWTYILSFLF